MKIDQLHNHAIEVLTELISIPSFSREEEKAADYMQGVLSNLGFEPRRVCNNVWAVAPGYDSNRPTMLLNSHLDTVKASDKWVNAPHQPLLENGKLTGLGSNDAGGALVALLSAFRHLASHKQTYNLIFAATAEEEISGTLNVAHILPHLGKIDLGIVGEPTCMQMAIAEKGLLVVDGLVHGKAGHAARDEGVNAITEAMPVVEFFNTYKFERVSPLLGPVKMTVTGINAGSQHNVIPDRCTFMVDIRVNECYTNSEIMEILKGKVNCELKPRSMRLQPSYIDPSHPVVQRGKMLGLESFGSPTTSDQALMPFTTLKIGPGNSARSHTANEYIMLEEIKNGIETYIKLLDGLII